MAPSVYLFVPNLIGYGRIVFAFIGFAFAYSNWTMFLACYATSQLLDAFDGMAARHFGQCSRFGAVLDMVTDRFSSAMLLTFLSHLYVQYYMLFVALAVLDFVSHWAQMYATLLCGETSHKDTQGAHPLMRLYYTSKMALFWTCVSQENVYLSLYAMHFLASGSTAYTFFKGVLVVSTPLCAFKQVVNVIQLKNACDKMVDFDNKARGESKSE